jgi:protocatechuate 3,4-dioxygenase beta subunit
VTAAEPVYSTDIATNIKAVTTTNAQGEYLFASLEPAKYTVAPGALVKCEVGGVICTVAQSHRQLAAGARPALLGFPEIVVVIQNP